VSRDTDSTYPLITAVNPVADDVWVVDRPIVRFGMPRPKMIIGPNLIHYWWIPEWTAAFSDAQIYLGPTSASRQESASTSKRSPAGPG
jgi:hypothetical protein